MFRRIDITCASTTEATVNFEDLVDPDYRETDPMCQMRDAYVWIAQQFHWIVSDHATGTVLDFGRASIPPPVGLACSVVQSWAAKPCQKRDGLFREIRQCLGTVSVTSTFPGPDSESAYGEGDAYLDAYELAHPDEDD